MDGQHGGKHYFEDNEYIESKKETTQTTVKSVQSAAKIVAERNKIAEAERREAERIAEERRQANGTYFTLENFTTEFDIERDIFALDYDANIRSGLSKYPFMWLIVANRHVYIDSLLTSYLGSK